MAILHTSVTTTHHYLVISLNTNKINNNKPHFYGSVEYIYISHTTSKYIDI